MSGTLLNAQSAITLAVKLMIVEKGKGEEFGGEKSLRLHEWRMCRI